MNTNSKTMPTEEKPKEKKFLGLNRQNWQTIKELGFISLKTVLAASIFLSFLALSFLLTGKAGGGGDS